MASEQTRRDNAISEEIEIHIKKDTVPKITSHFESLAGQAKEPDNIETHVEGAKDERGSAAKALGDVGGATHELACQFESLADKVKNEKESYQENEKEKNADEARGRNMVAVKEVEAREGQGGGQRGLYAVGKFEVIVKDEKDAEEAKGREGEAEKRDRSKEKAEEKRGVTEARSKEECHEERRGGAKMRSREEGYELGGDTEMRTKEECRENRGDIEEGQEKKEQPSLEEIARFRATAQQNSVEALRAAEERYERAKESLSLGVSATSEYAKEKAAQAKDTVINTGRTATELAAEKAAQAKDTIAENGAQAKDVVVNTGRTATELAAEKGAQAKDTVAEKGAQAKDTVLNTSPKRVHKRSTPS